MESCLLKSEVQFVEFFLQTGLWYDLAPVCRNHQLMKKNNKTNDVGMMQSVKRASGVPISSSSSLPLAVPILLCLEWTWPIFVIIWLKIIKLMTREKI